MTTTEEWLEGQYGIGQLPNYPSAMVVAHINNESCFEEKYELTDGVLQAEIPMGLLDELVRTPYQELKEKIDNSSLLHVPKEYFLQPFTEQELADVKEDTAKESGSNQSEPVTYSFSKHDSGVFPATADDPSEERVGNYVPATPAEPLKVEFGKDVQSGEVIYWEPTNTEKLFNTNTGIIGTMGTGKTQFTKSMITQLVRNQQNNVGQRICIRPHSDNLDLLWTPFPTSSARHHSLEV